MREPKLTIKLMPMYTPRNWKVIEEITYKGITANVGFISDLASIPLGFRWLFPHGGARAFPAVIHDVGYRKGLMTRKEVDDIFLEAMVENDVPYRDIIYRAVRMFGYFAYKGDK